MSVSIKYKGEEIASADTDTTKTLKTSGKYCEGDIEVVYTDPQKPEQSKTVTPTAAGFTVSPDSGKVLSSVVVNGDADLVASNVRSGKNIFGVAGTLVEGITPSGTKSITANGTYDVTQFASAAVNAPTFAVASGTVTFTSVGGSFSIQHGLNTKKILFFMQLEDEAVIPAAYRALGCTGMTKEFLSQYMEDRTYNFSYSTVFPVFDCDASQYSLHAVNAPSATATTPYHTPAGNVNVSDSSDPNRTILTAADLNTVNVLLRYYVVAGPYNWTAIGFY